MIAGSGFFVVSWGWSSNSTARRGWVRLVLGAVASCARVGSFMRESWARIVGVMGAVGSCSFRPYDTVSAVLLIAIPVAVIWSLTVHGDELARVIDDDGRPGSRHPGEPGTGIEPVAS